jgi:serine protease AprX
MARNSGSARGETRASALWGTGKSGDSRSNALWGKSGRGFVAFLSVLVVTALPVAAGASGQTPQLEPTYVDPILEARAHTTPNELVPLIIESSDDVSDAQEAFTYADHLDGAWGNERVKNAFAFTNSVAVTLKAKKVLELARKFDGLTITYDAKIRLDSLPSSTQIWPTSSGVRPFYRETDAYRAATPAIAVVDSGIDRNRADFDFGARVVAEQVITRLQPNSPGDGRGHGTFVAGIAAGSATDAAGAAPQANIVSLDVMDDNGMARTSDIVAAAEWIYQHRLAYDIRVANFSLHSTTPSNFTKDALDKAVEKLWFSGVTVVVAAGNYGHADGPSGVPFAPGNDPFVITVGAIDLEGTYNVNRHDVPQWSAYGYTLDGFKKPEISAAGRYIIGPVPLSSTLKLQKPQNVVSPTSMRLSGTSFAAPIVAGAAAQLLARHPSWTPDQVKGALMLRARYVREAPPGSAGVGELNADRSAALAISPPNPNLALNQFVVPDPNGGATPVFDAVSWTDAASGDSTWDTVSWSDVSWSEVSWTDVSWSDVSWSDVSWTDVSWSDVLAMEGVAWEDAAGSDSEPVGGDYLMTPEEEAAALADPDLGLAPPPPPLP